VTQALVATPPRVDLNVYQGDDYTFTLTVTDAAGNPVTLTGTVAATLAASPGGQTVASFGVSVTANVVTLTLGHLASATLSGGYVWDCQWTAAAGKVTTLAAGVVNVMGGVT
jgi:hypothetical protein